MLESHQWNVDNVWNVSARKRWWHKLQHFLQHPRNIRGTKRNTTNGVKNKEYIRFLVVNHRSKYIWFSRKRNRISLKGKWNGATWNEIDGWNGNHINFWDTARYSNVTISVAQSIHFFKVKVIIFNYFLFETTWYIYS